MPVMPDAVLHGRHDNNEYWVCVCSHFLILYSEHLTLDFHKRAIKEMLRVASDVRIFPVLALNECESEYVPAIMDELKAAGYRVALDSVDYEFQRGGNKCMRIEK